MALLQPLIDNSGISGISGRRASTLAEEMDKKIGARYGSAQVLELASSETSAIYLWERLSTCSYAFLNQLVTDSGEQNRIEDIMIWNALQPTRVSEDYQPISIEVRILKKDRISERARKGKATELSRPDEALYLPGATLDKHILAGIKDRPLQKAMTSVVQAIYMGDDPTECRNKLGEIRYFPDDGKHYLMITDPPSVSYWFLKALKEQFATTLRGIKFERLTSENKGLPTGTAMILEFVEGGRNSIRQGEMCRNTPRSRFRGAEPY